MLLALDTSTRQIGIALFDGIRILSESTWTSPFHHTVELAPAVEESLKRAGIEARDLTAIGAAIGPGSFTALRSGLAFAKGLSLTHNLPLIGIPSLDVIARSQPESDLPLIAVLEAGRKRLAVGMYTWGMHGWAPVTPPALATIEEVSDGLETPTMICGELSPLAIEILAKNPLAKVSSAAQNVRRPGVLAEIAWERLSSGTRDDPALLEPLYLSKAGVDA